MTDVVRVAVLVLVVVNPVSAALAIRTATEQQAARTRVVALSVAAGVAAVVLGALALAADEILDALDLSVASAELGAGVVLLVPALELLFGGPEGWVRAPNAHASAVRLGVFPLAVPVLASPWTAAAVLAIAGDEGGGRTAISVLFAVAVACALAVAAFGPPPDQRAVRLLGAAVGVATALVAADLVHDGVFGTG